MVSTIARMVLLLAWLAGAFAGNAHAVGAVSSAQVNEKVALVIGNGAYKFAPLSNPKNDATAMTELLTQAGFDVSRQIDASQGGLRAALEQFGKRIKDPNVKFAIFYYAGHAVQLNWSNYLIPVDAQIHSADELRKQSIDVTDVIRYMKEAKNKSYLIILDACREDPFAGNYRVAEKGLSQFDAPAGSLLAYATAPGKVAKDGAGENGLYTSHLLHEMAVQDAKLEDVFKRVRLSVRLESGGRQIPWETTSLEDDLYLFPSKRRDLSEAERDALFEKEVLAWKQVKTSTDLKDLTQFIRDFPSGNASELAQSRLSRLLLAQAEQKSRADALERQKVADSKSQEAAQAEVQRLTAAMLAASERAAAAEKARLQEAQRLAQQMALEIQMAADKANAIKLQNEREQALEAQRLAAQQQRLAQEAAAQKLAAQERERAALQLAAQEQERQRAAQLQAAQEQDRQRAAQLAAAQEQERARAAQQLAAQEQERQRAAQQLAAQEQERQQAAQQLAAQRAQEMLQAQERTRVLQAQAERQAEAERLRQAQAQAAAQREADELAQQRERLAKAVLPPPPAGEATLLALAPTPNSQGYSDNVRNFNVGDEYDYRVIDQFTKLDKPLKYRVSQVNLAQDQVEYNGGEYLSDLMGNIVRNVRGNMDSPRQFYPAEFYVGKKWKTRFKQTRPNGTVYTFEYDLKIVGRETVTVPAGTFDTFKIEARGFNVNLGAYLQRNIWIAPNINADIIHEIYVRLTNGRVEQNDRQELVRYRSAPANMANN